MAQSNDPLVLTMHTHMILIRIVVLGIFALCLWPAKANAQELSLPEIQQDLPWHLKADQLEVLKKKKIVHARGNVHLSQQGDTLQADYARYSWDNRWVYLKGDVTMNWEGDVLHAEEAEFDLENKVGWLTQGRVFFEKPHLYIRGEKMEKTGPSTYTFESATVTSCDGETPDWSLKTAKGRVRVEGYARLWHSSLQVLDRPVLYTPFLMLPVKTKRQSGFLRPEIAHSSEKGLEYNQPYYQVLGEEHDATFYVNAMSRRGVMLGAEYRTTPDSLSKGYFRVDWLQDSELAETEGDELSRFDNDGLIRPNDDRFWLRGKYNGYLGSPAWRTKLDLDYVSDQNYLREFDEGYSGYDLSRDVFNDAFGRDIDDKDALKRTSVWSVSRTSQRFGFTSQFEYTQNLRYMNDNLDSDDNPTLQRLPELTFDFYKQSLFRSPLEWEAQNELTYFWREQGTTGTRLDLYPGLSLPLNSDYGSLIPRLSWRETVYLVDRIGDTAQLEDKEQARGLWDFQVSAFTSFSKIFDLRPAEALDPGPETLGDSQWTKIQNVIQPRIEYSYLPEEDQDEFPDFDELDRIKPANALTYSLTSFLTARQDSVVNTPGDSGTEYGTRTDYRNFFRFDVEQSYDFEEADRTDDLAAYPDRRPFSDIRTELTLSPAHWLSLRSRSWFSPYEETVTEHEHMLFLNNRGRYQAYFGLDFLRHMDEYQRQNQQELKILRLGGRVQITPSWAVSLQYEDDLKNNELIRQEVGVSYEKQCWGIEVRHIKKQEETRVSVLINLLNLGAFTQGLSLAD